MYFPITRNYFFWDDFLYLYRIANGSLTKFLLDMHGGHLLMTRNAVFLLFYEIFGTHAAGYFWLVLLTHLLNVFLLFRIIRALTGSAHLACFGSALWGVLPVQEGTLGWYSVYGHVLATTFTLAVLLALVRTSLGDRPHPLAPLLWVVLLVAAATSFGVGIGVACAMPFAAALLLPWSRRNAGIVAVLGALAVATPFLYFGLQRLYVALYGGLEPSFWLVAGLEQWHKHVLMMLDLLAYGVFSTVTGVFHPIAFPGVAAYTLVALCVLAAVAVAARGSWTLRRRLLACLVLCAAAYAVIAAGRGMFSRSGSVRRYHYLSTAGLVIALCLVLGEIADRWPAARRMRTALLLVWIGASLAAHFVAARPLVHYAGARRETNYVLDQVRKAARSAPAGADVYIENRQFASAGDLFANREGDFPGWAAIFSIYFPSDAVEGRTVRFVEPDPVVIESNRSHRRMARLLVSPEDVSGPIYRAPKPAWAAPACRSVNTAGAGEERR